MTKKTFVRPSFKTRLEIQKKLNIFKILFFFKVNFRLQLFRTIMEKGLIFLNQSSDKQKIIDIG
jgi:hypothetical protein